MDIIRTIQSSFCGIIENAIIDWSILDFDLSIICNRKGEYYKKFNLQCFHCAARNRCLINKLNKNLEN